MFSFNKLAIIIFIALLMSTNLSVADARKSCALSLIAINLSPVTARALSNLTLVNTLFDDGRIAAIKMRYYDGQLPTQTVLKQDLEYIANNWMYRTDAPRDSVSDNYVLEHQMKQFALEEGAKLADRLNDPGAAAWYRKQAANIDAHLKFLHFLGN